MKPKTSSIAAFCERTGSVLSTHAKDGMPAVKLANEDAILFYTRRVQALSYYIPRYAREIEKNKIRCEDLRLYKATHKNLAADIVYPIAKISKQIIDDEEELRKMKEWLSFSKRELRKARKIARILADE